MCALTIKREVEIRKWMIFRERWKIQWEKKSEIYKSVLYGAQADM